MKNREIEEKLGSFKDSFVVMKEEHRSIEDTGVVQSYIAVSCWI